MEQRFTQTKLNVTDEPDCQDGEPPLIEPDGYGRRQDDEDPIAHDGA